MYISTDISPLIILLLSLGLLCLIYIIAIYVRRINRVIRAVHAADHRQDSVNPVDMSPVSVIVYSMDQCSWLEELLPDLLGQDYPAGFEVIVVNDGASEETHSLVENMALAYPNLYLTYTPDGVRSLSRKKLGITIGVKAAKYSTVVLVDAGSRIESPQWLQRIMANYVNYRMCDVVLGYAFLSPGDSGMGRRRRAFDYVADSVTWLTSAIARKPYMGSRYNLAYTRELFFRNKGFSRSLNLEDGDDDIFVSEIANGENTVVELSADSMVMANIHDHARALAEDRRRHEFTGRRVSHTSRRLMMAGELSLWITIVITAVVQWLAWPNLLPGIIALVFMIVGWIVMTIFWSRAMQALRGRRLRFSLPWLILMRPLRQWRLAATLRMSKTNYYTWKK